MFYAEDKGQRAYQTLVVNGWRIVYRPLLGTNRFKVTSVTKDGETHPNFDDSYDDCDGDKFSVLISMCRDDDKWVRGVQKMEINEDQAEMIFSLLSKVREEWTKLDGEEITLLDLMLTGFPHLKDEKGYLRKDTWLDC